MADYESKLADWFKYVDRQADAVKFTGEAEPGKEEEEKPKDVVAKAPAPKAPDMARGVRQDAVVADTSRVSEVRPISRPEIVGDSDIPEIEDFLPFLKDPQQGSVGVPRPMTPKPEIEPKPAPAPPVRPEAPKPAPQMSAQAPPVAPVESLVEPAPLDTEDPERQRTLFVSEGTGIPRPRPQASPPPPAAHPRPVPPRQEPTPAEHATTEARAVWDQLPKHVQLLIGPNQREVARASYREFKETRHELIHRLLDPPLTLEETARILNVCPTTIRRYTNRGLLPHFRTAGNQRRFRLSDVLAYLERQSGMGEAVETVPV